MITSDGLEVWWATMLDGDARAVEVVDEGCEAYPLYRVYVLGLYSHTQRTNPLAERAR